MSVLQQSLTHKHTWMHRHVFTHTFKHTLDTYPHTDTMNTFKHTCVCKKTLTHTHTHIHKHKVKEYPQTYIIHTLLQF